MRQRDPISLTDSPRDMMIKMSEGNPGAITALCELVKNDESGMNGMMLMLHLDDMNIRGSQVWIGYKDHCKRDVKAFIQCILNRDQAMVDAINSCRGAGDVPRAVATGASFGR